MKNRKEVLDQISPLLDELISNQNDEKTESHISIITIGEDNSDLGALLSISGTEEGLYINLKSAVDRDPMMKKIVFLIAQSEIEIVHPNSGIAKITEQVLVEPYLEPCGCKNCTAKRETNKSNPNVN